MTDSDDGSFVAPRHLDRFRVLRGTMAWRNGDADVLPLLAAECATAADVDALILAAFDCLARVCDARLRDPGGYLASWAAVEKGLADAETAAGGR
jgi:hypothetical protein